MKKMAGVVFAALVALGAAGRKIPAHQDQWLIKPVDQRTFQTYLEFFRYDSKLPLNGKVLGTEQSDPSFSKEHVSFQSTPGEQVTANLYRPAGSGTGKLPTIVLLHGGGGRGKDGPPTTVLGTLLARAGFQVLSPDLQYFGERASDKMFTTFTGQEKHEKLYNQPSAYLSWMIQNVKDISRALDFMVQERNADPQRIALVGISRGCRLPLDIGNDDLAVTFELRRHNFGMVGKPEVTRGAASRRNSFASLGTICPWHGSW